MEPQIGTILEGKVTTITKFGAFVALEGGKSGLVHISEIANTYVNDVNDFLTQGQTVKVMVLANENGKINLSIKRLEPRQPRENAPRPNNNFRSGNPAPRRENPGFQGQNAAPQSRPQRPPVQPAAPKTADQLFEEKLKAFMSESDSKLSSMRADHRTKSRRR